MGEFLEGCEKGLRRHERKLLRTIATLIRIGIICRQNILRLSEEDKNYFLQKLRQEEDPEIKNLFQSLAGQDKPPR